MSASHAGPIGLYIHIPFCQSKCRYCDFASYPGKLALQDRYIDAVILEMQKRAQDPAVFGRRVDTLFIGGGTPSLLSAQNTEKLLQAAHRCFAFTPDAECTVQMNPGSVTEEWLSCLRKNGINRVSMGAQAMQQRLLSLLGRIHTPDQVLSSLKLIRAAGFKNINCDVMLGLPQQTEADLLETLSILTGEGLTHLSCYSLIVEEGTPLEKQIDRGELILPGDEEDRRLYALGRDFLLQKGYQQYELSNFALPGRECLHNVHCWQRKEYLGIGCAAAGFTGEIRYRNTCSLQGYLAGDPEEEHQRISPKEAQFESVMLGLRMTAGIRDADFTAMHGVDLRCAFGQKLDAPIQEGLLTLDGGVLRLTQRGMDLQNRVLLALMD